jgi:leucine dehydrogenase
MASYEDSRAAIRDALRLSRAMTFKAAVADLPLGGGKGVIMTPSGASVNSGLRRAALLDFGDSVQDLGGRYITAEDVGTSSRDMSAIAERTAYVAGLPRRRGGSGDPSPLTALGVTAAIQACCERVFGSGSLRGRTIGVIGLGHVGSRVAKQCARQGAKPVLADVDPRKRTLADQLSARWSSPTATAEEELDVLSPCALGGFLDDRSVPRLRCSIIAGAANNQLAEERVADLLAESGILWAPDFVVNAGGIINIAEEIGGYEPARARRRVRGIGEVVRLILDEAERLGTTPLAAAMDIARRRLPASGSGAPARLEPGGL